MITTTHEHKMTRRDATYKMYVDINQQFKQAFSLVSDEDLEGVIASYMQLMQPPEGAEDITMSPEEVQQTALLAVQCLSRLLYERSK